MRTGKILQTIGLTEIILPPYGDEIIGVSLISAGKALEMKRNNTYLPNADYTHINSPYVRGEQPNQLYEGRELRNEYIPPSSTLPARSIPDTAQSGAYDLPGTALDYLNNHIRMMPHRDTTIARMAMLGGNPEKNLLNTDMLYYRSAPIRQGRRESGYIRALPSTVTQPRVNAVFQNGEKGNIYGY